MLPGPNYIYKCPNCGNLLTKGSLMSGNTHGAKMFSDGKQIAPMLPEFPNLTKCKKCGAYFWLSKLGEIRSYENDDNVHSEWRNADEATFLSIEDYFNAISQGVAENMQDELIIRQYIWWAYNDRTRSGEELFKDEADEFRWAENLKKLKALLDQSDINQKIMIAEINRNLGEFENCISIIESIDHEELLWLKDKFIHECKRKNKLVIALT